MKIVPFQRLAVGIKTVHHPLLHRSGAVLVMTTVKYHGRTAHFTDGVARMARANFRRLFVAHGGIICNERAHVGRRRNEMNAEPPTHAVTDHADARAINVASRKAIAPAAVDNPNEVGIRRAVLDFGALVDVSFRWMAKHMIEI